MAEDGVLDEVSGTVFDPFLGIGLSGPLADQALNKLPALHRSLGSTRRSSRVVAAGYDDWS